MTTADTSQTTTQPPADTSQNGSTNVTATVPPTAPPTATAADGITPTTPTSQSPDNGGTDNGGAGVVTTPGYGVSQKPRMNRLAYEQMLTQRPVLPDSNQPPAAPVVQPPAAPVVQPPAAPVVQPPVAAPTAQPQQVPPQAPTATPTLTPPAPPADDEVGKLRFRPVGDDAKLQAAVVQLAKESGKSILDPAVIRAARALHGLPEEPAPPPAAPAAVSAPVQTAPAPVQSTAPATPASAVQLTPEIAQVDTEIEALRTELKTAKANFLTDKELEIEEKLYAARARKSELMAADRHAQEMARQQADQAVFQEWNTHTAKAVAKFPDAANPTSALALRAAELQAAAKLRNDPMVNSVMSGQFFIQAAADDLGILPVAAAPVSPVVTTPAPPSVRPPASALIAGGQSQQATKPGTDSAPRVTDRESYDQMMNRLRGVQYAGR